MERLLDVRTAAITSKGQISIPKLARAHKGFSEGSRIAILSFPDRVELRPIGQLEKLYPALMSERSLKDGWSGKAEDRAWKGL